MSKPPYTRLDSNSNKMNMTLTILFIATYMFSEWIPLPFPYTYLGVVLEFVISLCVLALALFIYHRSVSVTRAEVIAFSLVCLVWLSYKAIPLMLGIEGALEFALSKSSDTFYSSGLLVSIVMLIFVFRIASLPIVARVR